MTWGMKWGPAIDEIEPILVEVGHGPVWVYIVTYGGQGEAEGSKESGWDPIDHCLGLILFRILIKFFQKVTSQEN